jgi:hypothetical protein
MSRGPGRLEQAITDLFNATKDRALSVADICDVAFELGGRPASRAQRLSATRAAHRALKREWEMRRHLWKLKEEAEAQAIAAGHKKPKERASYWNSWRPFFEAKEATPAWIAAEAFEAAKLQDSKIYFWTTTEGADGRLYFHPKNFPVRIWGVDIVREGVLWGEVDSIDAVEEFIVWVTYDGEKCRLDRTRLWFNWTNYRGLMFTSARNGDAAFKFFQIWEDRYYRSGAPLPQELGMSLAEAMRILGVPGNFTLEDITAGFRRMAKRCHPDHGGTDAAMRLVVQARNRLRASLGRKVEQHRPKLATYKVVYRKVRLSGGRRLGERTRRLSHG